VTWKTATLGQLVEECGGAIQTGPFGAQLHQNDYREDGTPAIMPQNIVGDRIVTDSIARVDEAMVSKLSRHVLKVGDIIYPRRGDLDKRALIGEQEAGWLCGTGCIKISLPDDFIAPGYLFYHLKQPQVVRDIENNAVGATMLNLSAAILKQIKIQYPDITTQQRIADILSNYDRLIDNNTRRIALLEESIHRLYKEWFVYLRFPGCDRVKVFDGVPEGWDIKNLGDVVLEIIDYRGKTPKKLGGDWSESGIIALSALNIKQGRLINLEKSKFVDENLYQKWMKSELRQGDIPMISEAPLGELYYFAETKKFCLSQRLYSIRANPEIIRPAILFCTLNSHMVQGEIHARQSGTTVLGIRQADLRNVPIVIPSLELQDRAAEIVDRLFQQKECLQEMINRLREARNLLLPRLMNGSIAV